MAKYPECGGNPPTVCPAVKGPERRFISEIQQGIPRKYSHILTILFVGCQLSPAVIIIVHGRQIVMHQRIGMYHLHRHHKRPDCRFVRSSQDPVHAIHKKRTQPLTAGLQTVIYRLEHRLLISGFLRQIETESLLRLPQSLCKSLLNHPHHLHPPSVSVSSSQPDRWLYFLP